MLSNFRKARPEMLKSNMVKIPIMGNGTHDFKGQKSGVHISAPLMNTTKNSTDSAMGGPPVYGVHFRFFSTLQEVRF